MGCMPSNHTIFTAKSKRVTFHGLNFTSSKSISVLTKIPDPSWVHIVDYLKYQELKEVGKTNKYFNNISKRYNILIKFFKKHNDSSKTVLFSRRDISGFRTDVDIINTVGTFSHEIN